MKEEAMEREHRRPACTERQWSPIRKLAIRRYLKSGGEPGKRGKRAVVTQRRPEL